MQYHTRLRRAFVDGGKRLLVRTNRHDGLRPLGVGAYGAMRLILTRQLGSLSGVRAVYLCHSLALGECYPGLSDFDIAVVFDDPDTIGFYRRIRGRWGLLKRYLPVSDLSILTVDEFETWQRTGGGWDPLDEVRHWKLLTGDELRHDAFNASSEEAALDRMQWSLGHFQNLLGVVLKEEKKSPLMAIVARRQLHKCFWNTVLALDPRYLSLPTHRERVNAWMSENGTPPAVAAIQAMYAARFFAGPVTSARFDAAALAYTLADEAFSLSPLLARRPGRPVITGRPAAITNHDVLEQRCRSFSASIVEIAGENIESVLVGSTGTSRGYALHLVLKDGLSHDAIVTTLRDIRAVFRVFDDPWFNEHIPAGIPTVSSRSMFRARLRTGRSSLHYLDRFRKVIYGSDVYEEAIDGRSPQPRDEALGDWKRERLLYSLNLHQVYIGRLKPALHDFVTFYLPRLVLQRERGIAPATAEEAVALFEDIRPDEHRSIPRAMLQRYHGKDLDSLIKTMRSEEFDAVWPLLSEGLHRQGITA
jgi:hypothetical protein